ncbi:MAG: hypothetical protein ACRD0G_06545, partial [Acidimicrobiales bacterium]
ATTPDAETAEAPESEATTPDAEAVVEAPESEATTPDAETEADRSDEPRLDAPAPDPANPEATAGEERAANPD